MLVRMKTRIGGYRNGEAWPEIGDCIDVPDHEGRDLIASRYAEPVDPEAVADALHTVDENDKTDESLDELVGSPNEEDDDDLDPYPDSDDGSDAPPADTGNTTTAGDPGEPEPVADPPTVPKASKRPSKRAR